MTYCRHDWKDRTKTLLGVFPEDVERSEHRFLVCGRCLRIRELRTREQARHRSPRRRVA